MHSTLFKKLLIPSLALATILACGPFAASTPQPAATLNALYTAAARINNKGKAVFAIAYSPTVAPGNSASGYEVGVRHSF